VGNFVLALSFFTILIVCAGQVGYNKGFRDAKCDGFATHYTLNPNIFVFYPQKESCE
jgi:hypothetical protein